MVKRASWLSITPEPERELPEAVATMSAGHRVGPDAVAAEQARIERLILHGTQRRWLAYLHDVVSLIAAERGSQDPDVAARTHPGDEGDRQPPQPPPRASRGWSPTYRQRLEPPARARPLGVPNEHDDGRQRRHDQRPLR